LVPFLERHSAALALGLVLIASARIAATYMVFNHTVDEPAHIACGMEWLDKGVYTYEPQHPPLARVAVALGPYILGIRSQGTPEHDLMGITYEGAAILDRGGRYDVTLAAARLGTLPFFWIACLVVWVWAKRDYGAATAAAAVFLFSFLPPVLAHAGLATTDMALTAWLGAAFLTGLMWVEQPSLQRAACFGLATGLAVLSKFSSLAFFPAAAALALAWYAIDKRPSPGALARAAAARLPSFCLAVAIGFLAVWAGYRFSLGPLFQGIRDVMKHNAGGHPSYLLGKRSLSGFWYFYPVALAVKTPLAFLAMAAAAGIEFWRRRLSREAKAGDKWRSAAPLMAGVLLVALFSSINIGVRHILPVYLGLSVIAAGTCMRMLEGSRARIALALLVAWFAGSSLASHPDYLAYFNELAGGAPEKILADSDLDWGQDMKRLSARLRQAGAPEVTFDPLILADFEHGLGFPRILPGNPLEPAAGWNAVSLTFWKVRRLGLLDTHPEITALWPDRVPPGERVGKGTMLWYFPPRPIR
jgi:hypothetical protein